MTASCGADVSARISCAFVGFLELLHDHPLRWAAVGMVLLFLAYWAIARTMQPRRVNLLWAAVGADGRLSTSMFQFMVWTIPVLYVALALVLERMGRFSPDAASTTPGDVVSVPTNILIALGLSLSTMLGAKGIVVGYQVRKGSANTTTPIPDTLKLGYLIQDDNGNVDLTKVQMLAWTAIAIFGFLYSFFYHAAAYGMCNVSGPNKTLLCFPDIDTALMVLMGLGQGTYLGGKLIATTQPPAIESLIVTATTGFVGVTLTGSNLSSGKLRLSKGSDSGDLAMSWGGSTAIGRLAQPFGTPSAVVPVAIPAPPTGTVAPGDSVTVFGTINNVTYGPQNVSASAGYTAAAPAATVTPPPPAKSTLVSVTISGTNLNGGVLTINDTPARVQWSGTTAIATVDNPIGTLTVASGTVLTLKGTIGAIDYGPVAVTVP